MRGRNNWLLILLILLTAAGVPAASGYTKSPELRFDLYHDYLIVVRGSAGPVKGLNFLLDTGANPTILDRQLARSLHLDELPGLLAGVNGTVAAGKAIVPSLQLGPMRRDNLPVVVEDLSFFYKAIPVHIDAVIGLDVVGQSPFEIDYGAREIHFGPIPSLKNALRLQMKRGLPLVDVQLDQTSAQMVLDTGASSLILFAPRTPSVASPVRISAVQQSSHTMGEFAGKTVWLHSLRLGQAEFRREPAVLVQSRPETADDFDGLVSPALLGITKIAIDLDQGVFAFNR
jgi:predicted aspartyl protease